MQQASRGAQGASCEARNRQGPGQAVQGGERCLVWAKLWV